MKKLQTKAFTLVELVVTIIILAILGTIAFISMQSYSTSARNSTRVSDLSLMKTSLELFHLDAGKYPETTSGFIVTYSGTEVWTQGVFGETTKSNVDKLDKIPKDPLTEKEYTYSITKTKQEYQLAGLIEGDLAYIPLPRGEGIAALVNQTNAGEVIATAVVTGNYNGQTLKTETGVICEILSIPSIISSETTTTDLETILNNRSLVYDGYNNLPSNYEGSKYKTNEGFDFETKKLIVYSDDLECKPLYDVEIPTARIDLVKNLQTAYSGTLIENSEKIKGLITLDLTDLDEVNLISTLIVNNNLGGDLEVKESSKYTVSGSFGLDASGATINVCGTNVTADTSGNFSTTLSYGSVCNTITATKTGYSCNTTTNGPASLISNITNIAGSCTPIIYQIQGLISNGGNTNVSVCGQNVTTDSMGYFNINVLSGTNCSTMNITNPAGKTCYSQNVGSISQNENLLDVQRMIGSCINNDYSFNPITVNSKTYYIVKYDECSNIGISIPAHKPLITAQAICTSKGKQVITNTDLINDFGFGFFNSTNFPYTINNRPPATYGNQCYIGAAGVGSMDPDVTVYMVVTQSLDYGKGFYPNTKIIQNSTRGHSVIICK